MRLQPALRQSRLERGLEGFGFQLAPTVYQSVIRIPTPWQVGMCPLHPKVEGIVQEEIGEYRANDAPLRGSACSLYQFSVLLHGSRQPSLDVQQRPFVRYMLPYYLQQQIVRKVVEQPLDVELKDPIVLPASLARHSYCIQGRFTRPVAIGVRQKDRFQVRLDQLFDHHLRDPV